MTKGRRLPALAALPRSSFPEAVTRHPAVMKRRLFEKVWDQAWASAPFRVMGVPMPIPATIKPICETMR